MNHLRNLLGHLKHTDDFAAYRLPHDLVERASRYGCVVEVDAGATLCASGTRSDYLYIVLDGTTRCAPPAHPATPCGVDHGPGTFTGELDLLNDIACETTVVASSACRLVRIHRATLGVLLEREPDLRDLLVRLFLLRRIGLLASGPSAAPAARGAPRAGHRDPGRDPGRDFDVAIVGSGPSGMIAAAHAASRRLNTIVVEGRLPFGIDDEFARADTAELQRFGPRLTIGSRTVRLDCDAYPFGLVARDGERIGAHALVIASSLRPEYDPRLARVTLRANTEWLGGAVDVDDRGFVRTGRAASGTTFAAAFETSQPGMFAIGEVRAGPRRSAVANLSEGAVAVEAVRRFIRAYPA
ncbi:cyclic nucleotide-binding domain-containing protein [Burkholderia sp. MSMB1498]|uniref:cyclic nucleotide-binding domain-containing protein n=1 Tax=Burkholderia sp. MSMB1498 TaxID=1637842 RepID=UPI00075376D9|nr:cyclic nucleotide-binding domain-containing protein [Burkholderia sp. MSMB1498]KVK82271.1 cyclic nucleotide-binding protein [Burkholderia sp. MSMB1498]